MVSSFYTSLFIELCCGETSELCKLEHTTTTCLGVRITARHDITSERTLDMLNHCVTALGFGKYVVVWMSFRCSGGSQLQQLNEWKAKATGKRLTIDKIEASRKEFRDHFHGAAPFVRLVRGLGGHLALELPRGCQYWGQPLLTHFVESYALHTANFDGCMYGLVAKYGESAGDSMLKHWRLVTTSSVVAGTVNKRCSHVAPHVRIEGRNTKCSENYPSELAKEVHRAFRDELGAPGVRVVAFTSSSTSRSALQ